MWQALKEFIGWGQKDEPMAEAKYTVDPLHRAIRDKQLFEVKRWIEVGFFSLERSEDNYTPLQTAMLFQNFECAEWLIRKGANVNPTGTAPLDSALLHGQTKLVRLLLLYGADFTIYAVTKLHKDNSDPYHKLCRPNRIAEFGQEFLDTFDHYLSAMEDVRDRTRKAEQAEHQNVPKVAAQNYLENALFFIKENIPPQAEKHLNKALPLAERAYTQTPSPETATLYAQALTAKASLLNLDKAHNHRAEIIALTAKAGELTKSLNKRPRPPSDEAKEPITFTPAALRHLPRGHNGYTQLVASDNIHPNQTSSIFILR